MARGNRGKQLEKDVRDYLKDRATDKEFTYYRLPDARACGKGVGKQPGDYFIFRAGKPVIILDPKELKGSMRLNIKSRCSQLPKMNRLAMAGLEAFFLVHQTDENLYFIVSRSKLNKAKEKGEKSINLRQAHTYEFNRAMEIICSNQSD